ncbi:MAG: hypothetical protein CVU36_01935 [Betaproteobacteria bacterium HGW-Betaproteobacteria-9]|jgi:hypothetical protein|nr:MAG: hypothetical protein CVU36_01935 [Betaproteobacteria bacterium HGW-Betaproteobacteria-9]
MPITSFRGEKSLAEIADLMFERLTPKQREKAEAAILKANPRLSDLSTLPRGAVLKVPDLPELRAKARRAADDPPAQVASEIGEALTGYGKQLAQRTQQGLADNKEHSALIRSDAFKRALEKSPELKEQAALTTKALELRGKELAERAKTVETAIQGMLKNLKAASA